MYNTVKYPSDSIKGSNSIRQPATLHPSTLRSYTTTRVVRIKSKGPQIVIPIRSNRVYPEGISKEAASRKRKWKPFGTVLSLLTQIGLLSWSIYANDGVRSFYENPFYGPTRRILIDLGAKDSDSFYDGEYFRVITPLFLHAGVFQLLITLVVTLSIGWTLERKYNSFRWSLIYIFSGVMGYIVSVLVAPMKVSTGALPAILGLVGANFVHLLQNWEKESKIRGLFMNIIAIFCCGVAGFFPYCDNFSNITGLICGVFLGTLVLGEEYPLIKIVSMMFSLLAYVGILAGCIAAFLFHEDLSQYCQYCNYLNCLSVFPDTWCVPIN